MSLMSKLAKISNFDQLNALSKFDRLKRLAEAGAEIFDEIKTGVKDAKATLSAKEIEELRPLMDRIVPAAIEAGKDLDARLEEAKKR